MKLFRPKPLAVWAALLVLWTATPARAVSADPPPPDREMLRMMDLLRDMEMIKQIDMLQEINNLGPRDVSAKSAPAPKAAPSKQKEGAK